jgi:hypothetical protein
MPTGSSTRVTNGDPATVEVTVRDEPGGGGTNAEVDVLVVVDLTFATPEGLSHTPRGSETGDPPSTVRWNEQSIAAGDNTGKTYKVQLKRAVGSTVDCAPVTVVVTGTSGGRPYYYMQAPLVTFPSATSQPQP